MPQPILKERQKEWLNAVRVALQDLLSALAGQPAGEEDQSTVKDLLGQLDDLFLLVVVGEFNSGKSAFINALAGERIVEEGVVPTTSRIQVLKYGEQIAQSVLDDSTVTVTAPAPFLREIHIVDTPGTNAIERRHEAITQRFVPRADLILFVTSADRPFTESERAFLMRIRDWGKKIVIVVNKTDILETLDDRTRVEEFVRDNARSLLGLTPDVFPVSARMAFRAKTGGDGSLAESRFDALERYIFETLDEEERIRLKLLAPLNAATHIVSRHTAALQEQAAILDQDRKAVEEIERHLAVYREDLGREFGLRLADAENVLHQLEARGHDFIEDTVRLARLMDLINRRRIQSEFEKKVIADAPAQVERRVNDLIDWLVDSDIRQWEFLRDLLARRRSQRSREAVGELASRLDYDRARLVESVGGAAQRTLESYDRDAEASRMADSVQGAVAGTAVLEVGAVGLGTIVALLATSTAADITGFLAAGVLATIGFLVIPQKRRAAKKELREKIAALREQLMTALRTQFEQESGRSLRRLNESIAPYTRFVRSEQKMLQERKAAFDAVQSTVNRLRAEIQP